MTLGKLSRRTAIKTLGGAGAAMLLPSISLADGGMSDSAVKLGIIADLHGGLAEDAEDRLDAFVAAMARQRCHALVQMGDFAFPNQQHQHFADKFNAAHEQTVHVIGNHEFDFGLTREDCFRAWKISSAYYRRDIGSIRILVLDGNESGSPTHDGGYPSYIGPQQVEWLENEIADSDKPLVILSHQPLAGVHAVDNAAQIQKLLGRFQSRILVCLNGHSHVDSLVQVDGVPYLHINSASYFWVGGAQRMAYYSDPLFTTVTIDPETGTVSVSPVASTWRAKSPEELGYFQEEDRPPRSIVTPQIRPHHISSTNLNVLTWNIWGKLNQEPRYTIEGKTARERTIEIIQQSGADLISMIETYGSAESIATALGFHHHTVSTDANLCIFSRYPLVDVKRLEGLDPFSFIAATLEMPRGRRVRVYDIWLTSGGRHIVEIKNSKLADDEFELGDEIRLEHLNQLLDHPDFQADLDHADSVPIILAGDFNCVSHLDHTRITQRDGLNHSRVLRTGVSVALERLGFRDTFRIAHPEISAETLGHTWTTVGQGFRYDADLGFVPVEQQTEPEYRDPYARIDYIYTAGAAVETQSSRVIQHHPSRQDRSFPEFPSDHAAVLSCLKIGK